MALKTFFSPVPYFKGVVSTIDHELATLSFSNIDKVVHFGVSAANSLTSLPYFGKEVEVYDLLMDREYNTNLYTTSTSKIICIYSDSDASSIPMVSLIKEYDLGVLNLRILNVSCNVPRQLKVSVFRQLLKWHGKKLYVPKISTCSDLGTDNNATTQEYSVDTANSHEYLVGVLRVNNFGSLSLSGKPCRILSKRKIDLLKYRNKFVMVRNFTRVREKYVGGIEFEILIFKDVDVAVLYSPVLDTDIVIAEGIQPQIPHVKFEEIVRVYVICIAPVNTTDQGTLECWLRLKMTMKGAWQVVHLCLTEEHFDILPFLDVGHFYELQCTKKLELYSDVEISRVGASASFKVTGRCLFLKKSNVKSLKNAETTMDTLSEAVGRLNPTKKRFCNFVGLLTSKFFVPPSFGSRTSKQCTKNEFGTPGPKQHVLEFRANSSGKNFVLYLNNWERKLYPVGVVNNMIVCVRHAEVIKHYMKCDAFTSIELLGYGGTILLRSPTLLNKNILNNSYARLSQGHQMAYGSLVRARPMFHTVKSYRMEVVDSEPSIMMRFTTQDETGCALVICKTMELFQKFIVMHMTENFYRRWSEMFVKLNRFFLTTKDCDERRSLREEELIQFFDAMKTAIFVHLNGGILYVDMICRKMESDSKYDNSGMPVWYLVQVNRIVNTYNP